MIKTMNCTELALKEFLVRAKRNTYAGDGVLSVSSRPNSKDLHYSEGDLIYIDSYFGSADFIGEEVVFENQKLIWGMNYYGKMLVDEVAPGFSKCLKSALKAVPVEKPFRGPALFEQGRFVYKCSWQGDISEFNGHEAIYFDGIEIYRLSFHGGYIK
ncbi:DUF5680 domain-containing protein [Clostridium thermarum]|uniref:DUF5680 domain-containing protein n=2 Tax=Clostridium thermarum TaxID=1716543 RepID=UPI001FAB6D9C|nr:DUF5680 domain-containing protein [Clostridium thermarum]